MKKARPSRKRTSKKKSLGLSGLLFSQKGVIRLNRRVNFLRPQAAILLVAVVAIGVTVVFSSSASASPEIASSISGKCLDDYQQNHANGAKIDSYNCNGSPAQAWVLQTNGEITLDGKCLDDYGWSSTNGARVDLYSCNGGNNQKWLLTPTHEIVNVHANKCLDITGGSQVNGANIQLWTCLGDVQQQWFITHYVPVASHSPAPTALPTPVLPNSTPYPTPKSTANPTPVPVASPTPSATPPPATTSSSPYNPIPSRVVGAYWTNWDPLSLANTAKSYNMLWVFSASSSGTSGAVSFGTPSSESMAQLKTDIQARRSSGTCVMLTVGGAGASFYLTNQTQSQNFLNSIYSIYNQLGGVDGIDWDIESASMINQAQLVYIGQQLKAHYGQGFHITWAAADPSWITNGPAAVTAMVNGGALDAVDVMAYDYGQSSESAKIQTSESYVNSWVSATGSASRVIIGIELPNADDGPTNTFGSYTSAITLWNWAHSTYPTIRGMDIWDAYEDARSSGGSGGTYVSQVIPAVLK